LPQTEVEEDYIYPAFTRKPKIQSTLTEETAKFKCSFVASPRPKVYWYHGDSEIEVRSNWLGDSAGPSKKFLAKLVRFGRNLGKSDTI